MRRTAFWFIVIVSLVIPLVMPLAPTAKAAGGGGYRTSIPLLSRARSGMDMTTLKWLNIVNQVRREASAFTFPLPDWEEKSDYSRGAWLHARYIVMLDFPAHYEVPGPLATHEGAKAAQHSIILATSYRPISTERVIYSWLAAPFHGSHFFEEKVRYVGFGTFYRPVGLYHFAAVMDVTSDIYDGAWNNYPRPYGTFDAWPGPGTVLPYRAFAGGEYPDPLEVCPGYRYPVGPPIYVFTDTTDGETPEIYSARLTDSRGREVEVCVQTVVDWPQDTWTGRWAQATMFSLRVAFIIPKHPLRRGETYRVDVVAWDIWRVKKRPYSWQFRVADDAIFDPLLPEERVAYEAVRRGAMRDVRNKRMWNWSR